MPTDAAFWSEERKRLLKVLQPLILAAVMDGAEDGLDALPEEAIGGISIDWSLINQAAVDWANRYTYDLVSGITDTSAKFLEDAVSNWISSGEPLGMLIDEITPMFGPVRAEMISATEVTRAFATGNQLAWKASGVVSGRTWMTGEDEIVCSEICVPLDGKTAGLDEPFVHPDTGEEYDGPPAHPRCRCYVHPIVNLPGEVSGG